MTTKEKKKSTSIKIFWKLYLIGIVVIGLLFLLVNIGWLGYLPDLEELQNPSDKSASELYSADGQLIGQYFAAQKNRVPIHYNEINTNIINALVATEDVRFYDHSGIDGRALIRAIVGLLLPGNSGGGSTITQQLAKQLYSPTVGNKLKRVAQKPIEWIIAVKLERLYSKKEIIAMYLNQVDFVNNAVGIKSASHIYFNTTADKLNVQQAATLVGMCKNPWLFNPLRRKEMTKNRRNIVLSQMEKAGFLTTKQRDSISALPLIINYKRVGHKMGVAPYLRQHIKRVMMAKEPKRKNYADWQTQQYETDKWAWENDPLYGFCYKNRKPDGTPYNVYTDGLKIHTTIDSRMQRYAEEAVGEHMQSLQKAFFREKRNRSYAPFSRKLRGKDIDRIMVRAMKQSERYRVMEKEGFNNDEIEKAFNTKQDMTVFSYQGDIDTTMTPMDSIRYYKHFLRCGFMSMSPQDGYVKAYVGGPDYATFRYDMVSMGRRQIGSTVKPFLYTLAMEEGMNPCDKVVNQPITIQTPSGPWTPRNGSRTRMGELVTLRWGLAQSNNWITAYLISLFTPDALVNIMRSFGIKGYLDPVVSLALGPCEISVEEMVSAYTAFPQKGIRVNPLFVTHIEDENGTLIGSFTPKMKEVISAEASYKMISMLQSGIDEGTSRRIRSRYGLTMQAGGKTGTTNNNADGWFIGFTPKLVSGVWVGGEERDIHFDRTAMGQGASMALPIWAIYMKKVLKDKSLPYRDSDRFYFPESFDPNTGCISTLVPTETPEEE